MSTPDLKRRGQPQFVAVDESLNARRGFWLLNPYDLDAGWHVCINDGLGEPSLGDMVVVTRRDGSKTIERVASVEVVMARVGDEDNLIYFVRPEAGAVVPVRS